MYELCVLLGVGHNVSFTITLLELPDPISGILNLLGSEFKMLYAMLDYVRALRVICSNLNLAIPFDMGKLSLEYLSTAKLYADIFEKGYTTHTIQSRTSACSATFDITEENTSVIKTLSETSNACSISVEEGEPLLLDCCGEMVTLPRLLHTFEQVRPKISKKHKACCIGDLVPINFYSARGSMHKRQFVSGV